MPTPRAEMSDDQAKAVAYFYARLSAVYGPEYMRCFPDEKTEAVSKREHGPFIMDHTKAQSTPWKVGKNSMKCWKSAARNWTKNINNSGG